MNLAQILLETIAAYRFETDRLPEIIALNASEVASDRRKAAKLLRRVLRVTYLRSSRLLKQLGDPERLDGEQLAKLTNRLAESTGSLRNTQRLFAKTQLVNRAPGSVRLAV